MGGVEFLKERAAHFRKLAETEGDPEERESLLDAAQRCDRLVEIMEARERKPH